MTKKKRYHTSVIESIDNDIDNDNIIDNDIDNSFVNRVLIMGVCNSGKTYLMKNKTLSSECEIPNRQIKVFARSPNQNLNYETSDEIFVYG